jgi:hypothetical protein
LNVLTTRLFALALAALPSLAACATRSDRHGDDRSIRAVYTFGTLSCELPSTVPVLTAAAAAETTLRRRGYVITESGGTSDQARIVARIGGRDHGDDETTIIQSRVSRTGTMLTIHSGPLGDEVASRAILDGVLASLGL